MFDDLESQIGGGRLLGRGFTIADIGIGTQSGNLQVAGFGGSGLIGGASLPRISGGLPAPLVPLRICGRESNLRTEVESSGVRISDRL
jgi:hypothetical protein